MIRKVHLQLSNYMMKNLSTNAKKNSGAVKRPTIKLKTTTSKVKIITSDISKMPPPQPVLTPLFRNSESRNNQNSEHPLLPSFNELLTFNDVQNQSFRVELPTELQKRLTRSLEEVTEHFRGNFFAMRRELLIEAYTAGVVESETSTFILSGPEGSGKSVLLMQIYAMMQESFKKDSSKLVMYVPNAAKWTLGYFPYYPNENASNASSTTTTTATTTSSSSLTPIKISSFKQPELALEILNLLIVANKEKLSKDYSADMIEAKLDPYNRAIPLYDSIMKRELMTGDHENKNGRELYILMDGINGLIDENAMTRYLDQNGKPLPLKYLPICSQFFNQPLIKGIRVIGALTQSNPSLPRDLEASIQRFKNIKVPYYSAEDLKSVLKLYSRLGHCSGNDSDQFVGFKTFVSGGNGRKLFKSCEYDSIYYKP